MHISRSVQGGRLNGAGAIPAPSDAALIRLSSIAAQVDVLMAVDNPLDKPVVGVKSIRNDRRRTVEAILVLLADREVRSYLEELERLGLLPPKRQPRL
jgi:hypothetical protein